MEQSNWPVLIRCSLPTHTLDLITSAKTRNCGISKWLEIVTAAKSSYENYWRGPVVDGGKTKFEFMAMFQVVVGK